MTTTEQLPALAASSPGRGSTSHLVLCRAPVRISFGGGGTDLAAYYERFGGFVLSAAITRYCWVTARRPVDGGISINSADYRTWESFGRGEIPPVEGQLSLARAAVEWGAGEGLRETGVDLFLASEIEPGTGLGSSSAMAVALVGALSAYLGRPMSAGEVAARASRLEIERLGMPIGKQDQYASAYGGLNTLTFTRRGVTVQPLGLPPDVTGALSSRLLLFSTGRSRHSGAILRDQQADTAVKPVVTDSLHALKALAYTMCDALVHEDLDRFGSLLDEAWSYKKRLSGRISSGAIDRWYAAARDAGALGGKITGAGGGGFLLLYCPPCRQRALRAAMGHPSLRRGTRGLRELTFEFDYSGVSDAVPEEDRSHA